MSLMLLYPVDTATVPELVPSVFHRSFPKESDCVVKYARPLYIIKLLGIEFVVPLLMSFTITVPALVPSVFHSSEPLVAS